MLSEKTYRKRLSVSLLFTLCLPAPALGRQQQPAAPAQGDGEEVIRISSELVQTDVMVFGKDGKFVEGLKPEQFVLKVEGKERPVVFFERIVAGSVDEDAQLAAARGGRREGGAVRPLDRGRSVIFFVDDLHLSPGSSMRMRDALLRFIDEEVGQNDEAQVASASGQVGFLQQFTDNKAVLRAAARRLNSRASVLRDGQYPPMSEVQALAVERYDPIVTNFFVEHLRRENPALRRDIAERMVQSRAGQLLLQSNALAVRTLASLEGIIRDSAPLPGRKVLFFISDGFVMDSPSGDLRDRMRRIADAAARASVVIYSLDGEGLRTNQPGADQVVAFDPSGQLSTVNMSEGSTMQAPLYTLALETGGRALVNTNAALKAVSGALKETGRYYLLAWRPEGAEARASKYQRVEVTLRDRPDLKVVVRRGFFTAPQPDEEASRRKKSKKEDGEAGKTQAERELTAAIQSHFPRRALPTLVSLGYMNSPAEGTLLNVSVEVDPEAVAADPALKNGGTFDLAVAIFDDKGKAVGGSRHELTLTPAPPPPARRSPVMFNLPVPLAEPGLYQVRVATRDRRSGRAGSAMEWIEVPDLKKGQLSLSSVFLAERAKQAATGQPASAQDALISIDRRFSRDSFMRFGTVIYNAATAQPDVALQVQIFRDDQPVFTAPLSKLQTQGFPDTLRIPYAAELSLAGFPAGRYALKITAIDRAAKSSASQRVNFIIE
ncbi:MAG TPA: VWA domain-containing protein [Pyrinomonadaceae bacterium]|nr:VWA domain-containing protein [Pyrinomonadaceae bacterium]